jgi:hypothetical protein
LDYGTLSTLTADGRFLYFQLNVLLKN